MWDPAAFCAQGREDRREPASVFWEGCGLERGVSTGGDREAVSVLRRERGQGPPDGLVRTRAQDPGFLELLGVRAACPAPM